MQHNSRHKPWLVAHVLVFLAACGLVEEPAADNLAGAGGTGDAAGVGGAGSRVGGCTPDRNDTGPAASGSPGAAGSSGAAGSPDGASLPQGDSSVCSSEAPVAEADFVRLAAETLCSLYENCECTESDGTFEDFESCRVALEDEFIAERAEAEALGLTYSEEAAGALVERWRSVGCRLTDGFDRADCCPVYTGTLCRGADCARLAFGSECAPGSNCTGLIIRGGGEAQQSVCEAAACSVPVGLGERCGPGAYCGSGDGDVICSYETSMCERLPVRGESCTPGSRCGDGTHCPRYEGQSLDPPTDPVCKDHPGPGEPCERVRSGASVHYSLWGECEDGSSCEDVDGIPTCVQFAPRREEDGAACETSDDCVHTCVDGECMTVHLCNMKYF